MEKNLFESMGVELEELETPTNVDTSVKDQIVDDSPDPTSPEWNSYVLSLFVERASYMKGDLCVLDLGESQSFC